MFAARIFCDGQRVMPEVQTPAGQPLGYEDNLSRVHGEVFHNVVDRFQHGNFAFLNKHSLDQALGANCVDDHHSPKHCRTELARQLFAIESAARGKFFISLTAVVFATYARNDPLRDVATKMQHQIGRRVLVLAAASPDLLVTKLKKTTDDAMRKLLKPPRGEAQK